MDGIETIFNQPIRPNDNSTCAVCYITLGHTEFTKLIVTFFSIVPTLAHFLSKLLVSQYLNWLSIPRTTFFLTLTQLHAQYAQRSD